MSLLADALQPLIVPELFSRRSGFGVGGIADLLIASDSAYMVDFDDATSSMDIRFGETDRVVGALAASASRMSTAAFQTMEGASVALQDKNALPWSLVKIYYAAFYAGHALIGFLGESCSYFEGTHAKKLREFALAIGATPAFAITKGLHRVVLAKSSSQFTCVHLGSAAGGMHEQFWDVFGKRISSASAEVLAGPLPTVDAQTVFSELSLLTAILRRFGTHSWLSRVRNAGFPRWGPADFPSWGPP